MTKSIRSRKQSSAPISLRITAEEREQLEKESGTQTLSAYIRAKLFGYADVNSEYTARPSPQARQKLLAQILSELGNTRFSESLHDIAQAVKLGVLPVSSETLTEIEAALSHIKSIRKKLLEALKIKPGGRQ